MEEAGSTVSTPQVRAAKSISSHRLLCTSLRNTSVTIWSYGRVSGSYQIPFEPMVTDVLRRLVHSKRWLEIDLAALTWGVETVDPALPCPKFLEVSNGR